MTDWSVQGLGAEVTVTSAEGDVYPFHIATEPDLHLELNDAPAWHDGREPADADRRIDAALAAAARWTTDMFGTAA